VVIAVYNGERFLGEAIDSVLAQSFADFELIVVDDGSTDATPAILAEYSARDARMRAHRQANQGTSGALNAGIALARAPLIARLDADDLALPGRFERQVRFLAANPAVGMVGGQVTVVDGKGREVAAANYPLDDAEIRPAFAKTTPFVHSAVTMRKAVVEEVGGYRLAFANAEDLDLWLRIAERAELANLPETVAAYRIHGNQASAQSLRKQAAQSLAARVGARARAAGEPDPFAGLDRLDEETVLARGVDPREMTVAVVEAANWMARTLDRAGQRAAARELSALAHERASSEHGSAALLASVQRSLARRLQERGKPFRARLKRLQAAWIERRG
jgi:glycosyltransferase involved in cell wall biosynthesis